MNLRDKIFAQFSERPRAIAFSFEGRNLTFGELHVRACRWAGFLTSQGVQPGDRVACHLATSLELIVVLVGNYYAGAVHVPINTRYGNVEIDHILQDSGAKTLVSSGDSASNSVLAATPSAKDLRRHVRLSTEFLLAMGSPQVTPFERDDEDTALMIYTSGTTGKSKGVELSYRALVANIDALTRAWRWTSDDVLVLALPLFHVHGLCIGVHGTLLRGTRSVLQSGLSPKEVAAAFADGATIFMGVPTMYSRLVDHIEAAPEAAQHLAAARLFTSGSAALSPRLFARFEAATGHKILERYGMSETLITLSNPYDGERRPGTVGRAVEGCEVRIVDEAGQVCEAGILGEIQVRGDSMMSGYWRQPEQTSRAFVDGWFCTGDVAHMAKDGYVSIVGRRSVDIIKSGGYKISAREIELVLEGHPNVREIAVVGVPNEEWGESICAGVVVNSATEAPDLITELQDLGRQHLADYKMIRGLVIVDELPRNALGKVQKHKLRGADFVET